MNFRQTSWIKGACAAAVLIMQVCDCGIAQGARPAPAADQTKPILRLFVDPCSTSVAGGKANLVASPLTRKGETYVGDYQLKVTPYIFKNEKGALQFAAPGDSIRKIERGKKTDFTGTATSIKGKTKVITGTMTPAAPEKGTLTCSVMTDNGKMVFNTSYHLEP
jgi:hypothetical protein